jgi:murein L,D-transpeptidase YafK
MLIQTGSFKETQIHFDRVRKSYDEKEETVKQYFEKNRLTYKGFHVFFRAFKQEEELEVWVREAASDRYTLLHTYAFCANSGTVGPKRKEGDMQIPEGVYHINHFNPQSKFYLSLGINYPNTSDKILSHKVRPGGSIYIHGNCVTVGCIPVTDDKIKELYILAVEAKNNGQQKIPVHIFPIRLTDVGSSRLQSMDNAAVNVSFWRNLKTVFDDFEKTQILRPVKVNESGQYAF